MTWPRRLGAVLVAVCTVAVAAGCSPKVVAPSHDNRSPATLARPFQGAAVLPPADLTNDGPGSLLEVTPMQDSLDFDQVNAVAVRVVYRSTDSKGAATNVSGIVAVPPGEPPSGGWPILAFGHDITGLQKECAPSLAQNLGSYASIISLLVDRGYVVAMTDYQGLGLDGFQHPLLDSTTLGNNMIDAVRAARHVLPAASNRWAAFGFGQGGAAAWAADAQAKTYGAGLDLVGAVAVSPLADVTGLADAAEGGTLAPAQYRLQMLVVASLALSPTYKLDPYQYFSDAAKNSFGYLTQCVAMVDPAQVAAATVGLQPGDLKPKTPAAADQLRRDLQELALPGPSRLSAPMLVIYATLDPVVLPGWTAQALQTACRQGDPIEVKKNGDVSALTEIVLYDSVAWIQGRIGGQRATNICVGV
jgi:alpha-beta hydrolase superfamily lysophospholipase